MIKVKAVRIEGVLLWHTTLRLGDGGIFEKRPPGTAAQ